MLEKVILNGYPFQPNENTKVIAFGIDCVYILIIRSM